MNTYLLRLARHMALGLLVALGCMGTPQIASAAQINCSGSWQVNVPNIDSATLAATPVGGFITPWAPSALHSSSSAGCKGTLAGLYREASANFYYLTAPAKVSQIVDGGVTYDVFATNLSGIGYVMGFTNSCAPGVYQALKEGAPPAPVAPITAPSPCGAAPSFNVVDLGYYNSLVLGGGVVQPIQLNLQVRFVKLSATPATGALTGNLASLCLYTYGNGQDAVALPFDNAIPNTVGCGASLTVGASVLPITCDFGANGLNRTVTLPTVSASALNGATQTAGATPFSLYINCTNAVKVTYTFFDQLDPLNGVAVLTNPPGVFNTPTSTAGGVKVRLTDRTLGAPVTIGADRTVPNPGGPNTLPFIAEYYRGGAAGTVTPGSVNAVAQIIVNYQ